ncbi:MAG: calcium/sodium antiporter [Synechococcales cyanobacterium RM1_1_8]|nr:calcium/sodium antiporter [Synechococcales cyanobacterium RM1_1_8]
MITILLLIGGLVLLVLGAELLVRGASKLAAGLGISPLIIGLTIVAYGTSAPELAVSLQSSFAGQVDVAVGNVVGSNIFNVLMILGLSALVSPLVVAQQLIRIDVPVMVAVSALAFWLGRDGLLGLGDGLVLSLGAIAYTGFQIWQSRRESNLDVQAEYAQEFGHQLRPGDPIPSALRTWLTNLSLIAIGVVLLIFGSQWLVTSALSIARSLGVSELVAGLTIVAAGTSLPELATSVVATVKGERDIAVGNVVGSNIFNLLAVLGFSSLLSGQGLVVPGAAIAGDLPIMVATAIACLPIFFTGSVITRWEGFVFLGYYAAYVAYLGLRTTQHEALTPFSLAMLWFVIPLTVVTLLATLLNAWRDRQNKRAKP